MAIADALYLADLFDRWAGSEWTHIDAKAMIDLAVNVGEDLANLVERKRSVEQADRLRSRLDHALAIMRQFNEAYPIKWHVLAKEEKQTTSRGIQVTITPTGFSSHHTGEFEKPVVQAAQPAITASAEVAGLLGGWADEFATTQDRYDAFELRLEHVRPDIAAVLRKQFFQNDASPDPTKILNLLDDRWLMEYDDMERDEWSRKFRCERERREHAQQLVEMYGSVDAAANAVRSNLKPVHELLAMVDSVDEALAYVSGNGGPPQTLHPGVAVPVDVVQPAALPSLDDLPPRVKDAWLQYQHVADALGLDAPTARDAYDRLKRASSERPSELRLPTFATWERYVRLARQALQAGRNSPRVGRPHGATIVKFEDAPSKHSAVDGDDNGDDRAGR